MNKATSLIWFSLAAWTTGLAVCAVSFVAWGHDNGWQIGSINAYQLFPLLGLVAYGLMWSHYVLGTLRELLGVETSVLRPYTRWTGYAVLVLICLHPGLLIYQRFRDGDGLPPGSYESYVAPGLAWITLLGTACLLVFLAFELHRWFGRRSWWHYVVDASDLAMLAIFYHGLRLGSQLQQGWFRYVWWFYGLTLVAVIIRKYAKRASKKTSKQKSPA